MQGHVCCETQQLDNSCEMFERAKGELVVVVIAASVKSWFVLALQECSRLNNQRRWSHESQQ